jgi:hypothetical protein
VPCKRGEGCDDDRGAEQLEARRLITKEEHATNERNHWNECAELRGGSSWDALGRFKKEDEWCGGAEDASGGGNRPDGELGWDPWITTQDHHSDEEDSSRGEAGHEELQRNKWEHGYRSHEFC